MRLHVKFRERTTLLYLSTVPGKPTHTYSKQAQVNKAADRFYGSVPGGLFNLPITDDPVAEATLFSALHADGKVLPHEHSARLSSFRHIINLITVVKPLLALLLVLPLASMASPLSSSACLS